MARAASRFPYHWHVGIVHSSKSVLLLLLVFASVAHASGRNSTMLHDDVSKYLQLPLSARPEAGAHASSGVREVNSGLTGVGANISVWLLNMHATAWKMVGAEESNDAAPRTRLDG